MNSLACAGHLAHIVGAAFRRLPANLHLLALAALQHRHRLGQYCPDGLLIHFTHVHCPETHVVVTLDVTLLIRRMVGHVSGQGGRGHLDGHHLRHGDLPCPVRQAHRQLPTARGQPAPFRKAVPGKGAVARPHLLLQQRNAPGRTRQGHGHYACGIRFHGAGPGLSRRIIQPAVRVQPQNLRRLLTPGRHKPHQSQHGQA